MDISDCFWLFYASKYNVKELSEFAFCDYADNLQELELNSLEVVPKLLKQGQFTFLTNFKCDKAKEIYMQLEGNKNIAELSFPLLETINGKLANSTITRFEAPNLVAINSQCFDGCASLEDIDLSKVGTIPFFGFRNTALKEVELKDAVKISQGSFNNCKVLERIILHTPTPPTLENTNALANTNNCPIYVPDQSVEAYKTATNWITYADRIKSLFYYLGYIDFADSAVRDICVANFDTDGDGVVSIEEAAAVTDIGTVFQNSSIITFDEFKYFLGITTLIEAFKNCKSLKKISVPAVASSVSTYRMLYGCSALSDLVFNAETFGNQVLKGAGSIKNVVLGSNVKTADLSSALDNTYSPLNLYVGSGCNSISFSVGRDSAARSILFANIDVDAANTNYYSNDGCLYETSTNKLIVSRQRGEDEYTLPSFVSSLSDSAFAGTDVKKVIIPSNVDTSTNTYLFKGSLVEEVVFQNSMTSLTGYCFRDCKQLKKVTYPSTLTTFVGGVFQNCTSLTKFTIEAQVIGVNSQNNYGVFQGCTSLSALICIPENPPTAGINFIANTPIASGTGFIYVPDDSVDAYKAAANWSTYESQIKPLSEYPVEIKIAHIDGSLYTTDEWTSEGYSNDEADGVAVIGGQCSFIVAKEADASLIWGGFGTLIEGICTTTDSSVALADYDGVGNTAKIVNQLTAAGVTDDYAAKYCSEYTFPSGKKGYLPALGEVNVMINNRDKINSAMALIGASTCGANYRSSTQRDAKSAWFRSFTEISGREKSLNWHPVRVFGVL